MVLLQSSLLTNVSTTPVFWPGGRTNLVIQAGTWPGAPSQMLLQLMGPGNVAIPVASSFVADQIFPFDAPPGMYRLTNSSGSSVVNVVATLSGTAYT